MDADTLSGHTNVLMPVSNVSERAQTALDDLVVPIDALLTEMDESLNTVLLIDD